MILAGTFRKMFRSKPMRAAMRRLREEQGQQLAETAVCMLGVMMLFFAVIWACRGAYALHFIASAAHEGARYAIVRGGSWSATCDGSGSAGSGYGSSMCTASSTDIANYIANRGFPGVTIPAGDVTVGYCSTVPTTATQACNDSSSPNKPGDIVRVTITYPYAITLIYPRPPFFKNYTWNFASTSEMVIAQ